MSSQVTEPKLVQPAQPEQPEQPEQSGEQESQSGSEDPDADPVFTPIFETGEMEMSEEFRYELVKHTYPNDVRWAVTNNPSRPLEGNPTCFYRDTVEQVYEYWKAEFIDEKNYKGDGNTDIKYTNFTFIVVDDQCMRSDPWEIIVACDAPDYGEADDETKVKYFRMPFEDGASCLNALEHLTMTPSEAETHSDDVLTGFPPASMMPVRNENGEWLGDMRPATREEGIKNKRRMLAENS